MNYRAYIAEFLGTATLVSAVLATLGGNLPIATPFAAALTVLLFVYTIGGISGAHLNPAVTLGLVSIKKINLQDAILYILAQVLGAVVAMALVRQFISIPAITAADSFPIVFAEAVGAFSLMFGISSVVFGKVSDIASGLVIGGSLLLGILLAASISNGVLNPAVAIGIGSVSASYLLAPIVGTVAGAQLYRWVSAK